MIEVRQIDRADPLYEQQCDLRQRVLFDPIGYGMDLFLRDFPGCEEQLHHFVAVFDHPAGPRVVGCASLHPDAPTQGCGKLMQMAVDPQRQGEGIGRLLVIAIEQHALGSLGLKELRCHARDLAYGFYQRLGWAFDSDPFDEVGIEHREMVFRADQPSG